MRFSFYVKEDKTAKEFVEYIENQLKTMEQKVVAIEEADILVVVGGDGTFLSAARKFSAFQKPIVGINLGRLGFLTEIPKQDAIRMLKLIIEGKYKVIDRMMIDVYLNDKYLGAYLNDAVLARSYLSRLIDIEVYQQEHMIVKTKGRRGYNINANGFYRLRSFSRGSHTYPRASKHLAGAYMPTYNLYKTYGFVF